MSSGSRPVRWSWFLFGATVAVIAVVLLLTASGDRFGLVVAGRSDGVSGEGQSVGGWLAYATVDPATGLSGLYVVDARSGEPRRILGGTDEVYLELAWSPDGRWLTFTAGPDGSRTNLYRAAHDGTDRRLLADGRDGAVRSPIVAPDGRRIAFTRQLADGSAVVFVMDADGAGERRLLADEHLTVTPEFACSPLSPPSTAAQGWSPDGAELLVRVSAHGCEVEFSQLAVVDVDSGSASSIPVSGASAASWSPDGTRLAVAVDGGLLVGAADGSALRDIGAGLTPAWSPRGDLVFVRARVWEDESTYGLWMAEDAGEARARPIVEPGYVVAHPEWSPAGSHVTFLGSTGSSETLFVVPAEGGVPTAVSRPDEGWVVTSAYGPQQQP